jgi:hypothetical protein
MDLCEDSSHNEKDDCDEPDHADGGGGKHLVTFWFGGTPS